MRETIDEKKFRDELDDKRVATAKRISDTLRLHGVQTELETETHIAPRVRIVNVPGLRGTIYIELQYSGGRGNWGSRPNGKVYARCEFYFNSQTGYTRRSVTKKFPEGRYGVNALKVVAETKLHIQSAADDVAADQVIADKRDSVQKLIDKAGLSNVPGIRAETRGVSVVFSIKRDDPKLAMKLRALKAFVNKLQPA